MEIRKAQKSDLPALLSILNYEITHGTATFDLEEKTLQDREAWLYAHNRENHPLLVACEDGAVAGYASLSAYREKEAYRPTVELSVYVDAAQRGKGVATALMEAILALAREDPDTHTVVSVITQGNDASIRLHEKFGFRPAGILHEAGRKFGRYLDVLFFELRV